jgi:hypothetical protein
MPNRRRLDYADALAHLLFGKNSNELEPEERAELDVLRAFDADAADEERHEQLAAELPEEAGDVTVHLWP